MRHCDYSQPWYHGSPVELDVLRKGSSVTQLKEIAKAFSHRPSRMSIEDDECSSVKHNSSLPGRLYVISEAIGPDDVEYLANTAGTHWQTQRDLQVRLLAELAVDDPPLLNEEEIAELREAMPEGTTGMMCEPD